MTLLQPLHKKTNLALPLRAAQPNKQHPQILKRQKLLLLHKRLKLPQKQLRKAKLEYQLLRLKKNRKRSPLRKSQPKSPIKKTRSIAVQRADLALKSRPE